MEVCKLLVHTTLSYKMGRNNPSFMEEALRVRELSELLLNRHKEMVELRLKPKSLVVIFLPGYIASHMWPGGAIFSELSNTSELRITVKCPGVFEWHILIIASLPQFTTSS